MLVLTEETNAIDNLKRSIQFLEEIRSNNTKSLKWFVIAFHGAIYSWLILYLKNKEEKHIYSDNKTKAHPLDRNLISWDSAYKRIKDLEYTNNAPFKPTYSHEYGMEELNKAMRNQMQHFRPVMWGADVDYIKEASTPLLDILKFCVEDVKTVHTTKELLLEDISTIEKLLTDI